MAKAELSARSVRTTAQARRIVRQRGLDCVKAGVFDMDGVLRGKYMAWRNSWPPWTRVLAFAT